MAENIDGEQKLLLSKIADTMQLSAKHCSPRYSAFLDPAAQALVKSRVKPELGIHTALWGGHEDAERKVFCAVPDWFEIENDHFPIALLAVKGQKMETLTHRDFLGSLMGLGIRRETVGDMIVSAECSYIFCLEDIAEYILMNLEQIGRVGVQLERVKPECFTPLEKKMAATAISVASMRLDALLAAALHLSRTTAGELIHSGRVSVNFMECENLSRLLCTGDLISVKGFGRLEIGAIKGTSKKGRIQLDVLKPI